ncbi:MAG: hypothetical protein WC695_00745 [Candidatus Omnitrophota bacterium]
MSCHNPEYQAFCAQTYRSIPSCKEIDSNDLSRVLSHDQGSGELRLIHQFFELREVFLQKKMIKFRAQGICMYPCVRPGDILHIEPRKAKQIKIGDIAVFRRSSHLFGHRAIDKGNKNGLEYIITRPDMARSGNDGPHFDQDILGIVSGIERKGKRLETAQKEYNLFGKMALGFLLKYSYLRQHLFFWFIYGVNYIQQFNAYRWLAGFLFPNLNKKAEFSIRVPINIKGAGRLNRQISACELIDLNLGMDKNSLSKWTIALDINSRQAASLSFMFRPAACPFPGWWLCESRIMVRYRGTVIEKELLEQADNLLKLSRINKISVSVIKGEYPGSLFAQRLGFKEMPASKEKGAGAMNKLFASRVIMERNVCESQAR